MALIKCPECKKSVSESASSCPKCGYPLSPEVVAKIKKSKRFSNLVAFVIVVCVIAYFMHTRNKDVNLKSSSQIIQTKLEPNYPSQEMIVRSPTEEEAHVDYSILESHTIPGIKRSLDVRLNERVSELTLQRIALELKARDPRNYERTFICYYLPGMKVGSGAWAITHFNPNLEVEILEMSVLLEKFLKQEPNYPSQEVIAEPPKIEEVEFTRAGRQFLRLKLRELDSFKSNKEFHFYGFGGGGPYNSWLKSIEAKRGAKEFSLYERIAVGDLEQLGLQYMWHKGRESDYTRFARREILKVIQGKK